MSSITISDSEEAEVPHPSEQHKPQDQVAVSLLDKLRAPLRSELSRKRKIEKPTTAANKRHKAGVTNTTDPKSITPAARVKEFPDECLAVRSGKLFCTACREEIALKKSTIKNHISCADKHKKSKKRLQSKAAKERDLTELLTSYDKKFIQQVLAFQ